MPNIKRYAILMVLALSCLQMQAQREMKDFWLSMPDSLFEYLSDRNRREMVDFYGMGVKAEVFNRLEDMSVMDTLSTHHTVVTLSPGSKLTVALLQKADGDSLLCMVRTFLGPQPESVLSLFDKNWKPLSAEGILPKVEATALMARPDTMTTDDYDRLALLVDPVMMSATFLPEDSSLVFRLSTPLLFTADRDRLAAILVDRKYKWDGRAFVLQ